MDPVTYSEIRSASKRAKIDVQSLLRCFSLSGRGRWRFLSDSDRGIKGLLICSVCQNMYLYVVYMSLGTADRSKN